MSFERAKLDGKREFLQASGLIRLALTEATGADTSEQQKQPFLCPSESEITGASDVTGEDELSAENTVHIPLAPLGEEGFGGPRQKGTL